VAPGERKGQHLVNLEKPWRKIRELAHLSDLRLHDLRHPFASIGAGAGLGLPVIGALLGHAQAATTARYAHLASDPLQQAANLIGNKLAAAMNVDKRMSSDEAVELGESAYRQIVSRRLWAAWQVPGRGVAGPATILTIGTLALLAEAQRRPLRAAKVRRAVPGPALTRSLTPLLLPHPFRLRRTHLDPFRTP
jgi:hypothetical protein